MTKEEIINELGYHGKYTKKIKQKLRKLLKEYHPDNNKDDNKTILVLYEVKKELENGTLKYKKNYEENIDAKSNITIEEKNTLLFLNHMIDILKQRKEQNRRKINKLYKEINNCIEEKNEKQDNLSHLEFEIDKINRELNSLLRIDIIERILFISIVILCLLVLIFKLYLLLPLIIVFTIFEYYYISIRNTNYNDKIIELSKLNNNIIDNKKKIDFVEENIRSLEKDELILKTLKNKINNDIQFYTNEINKINIKYDSKNNTINSDINNNLQKKL